MISNPNVGQVFDITGGSGSSVKPATASPKAPGTAAVGTSDKYAREDHAHPSQTSVSGNAGTATKLETERTIDGVSFDGSKAITHYAVCNTTAATVEKSATITGPGFANGITGSRIVVKFTYANTASNPTMSVNFGDAKPIMLYGTTPAGSNAWEAGEIVEFIYDGANYVIVDGAARAKAQTGGSSGVTSFKGRTGPVTPQDGDYTAEQVGAVPTTRTVNGKKLSANITLSAADVGAAASGHTHTAADVGAAASGHTHTAADVGALPVTGGTLTGDLRIKGNGNYGTMLNFGDSDFVHIAEPDDDCLEIKAKKINFATSATTDDKFTLNGIPIGGGASVEPATASPKAPGTAAVGTSDKYAREDHVHPSQTSVSGNAGSATKLATSRTIDGVSFNGSAAIIHYGTCSTAAGTAAKAVSCTGFSLVTGARIAVKFSYANTVANPTLNVNGTGAKPIKAYGTSIFTSPWYDGELVEFVYDGTNWMIVNGGTNYSARYHSHSQYVPTTRTINGKALDANITISQDAAALELVTRLDVGANDYVEYTLRSDWKYLVIRVGSSGVGGIGEIACVDLKLMELNSELALFTMMLGNTVSTYNTITKIAENKVRLKDKAGIASNIRFYRLGN